MKGMLHAPASALALLLLVFLLLAAGGWAAPARIALKVQVAEDSRRSLPGPEALLAGTERFVARQWPSLFAVSDDGTDAAATASIGRTGDTITVATGIGSRALRSTVPAASIASLIPTMAGDLAWLWLSSRGFAGLQTVSQPELAAVLQADSLAPLASWGDGGLEPMGIASSAEGVTVLFPHRWITLGPLFQVTRETMRDLQLQPQPSPSIYTSIARGARGSILVTRDDGSTEEIDPLTADRATVAPPAPSTAAGAWQLAAAVFASDVDGEGNRWTWDARERRVRVTAPGGSEVFAIRPLARPEALPSVQALAVTPDGGFLLGGAGQLWKFADTGVPAWRMTRLPGAPVEALPASFAVAVDRTSGGFWLLDGPSRRLLAFAPQAGPPAGPAAELAAHLSRMDSRNPADLDRALQLALAAGSPLAAARFAAATPAVELALMRDEARAAAELVDELAAELLDGRAAEAAQRGVELARALRDRDPSDTGAAGLLESLTARRRDLREASASQKDGPTAAATAQPGWSACGGTLRVGLTVQAPTTVPLDGIRVSVGLPGLSMVPASAVLGSLAPGETGETTLELALKGPPVSLPATAAAAVLVSWQRPGGASAAAAAAAATAAAVAVSLVASVPIIADPDSLRAGALACMASAADPFIASELDALVGGSSDDPAGTLLALDALARLGQRPPHASPSLPSGRSLLRSLPADGPEWSALAAAVLAARRQPVGILSLGGALTVVVDTGLDLQRVIADRRIPPRTAAVLRGISRSGRLCLPVAEVAPAAPAAPAAPEGGAWPGIVARISAGLQALSSEAGAGALPVRWIEPGEPAARGGFGLPVALPFVPSPGGRERLMADILSELER